MKNKDFLESPKTRFILWFGGVFLLTFSVLFFFGFVPNELTSTNENVLDNLRLKTMEMAAGVEKDNSFLTAPSPIEKDTTIKEFGEEPFHLSIPNTTVDVLVQNPKTTDSALLDEYLARGAVRYPESALLGAGNVFLFAHSTRLAVVQNPAYKSFNGIKTLKRGDTIYVDSKSHRYVYVVEKVSVVSAEEEFVDFSNNKNMLTLSTCNTFGKKEERYVVTAIFDRKTDI
ncbi:MAG TPA: sortase [Candidatus Paceibacterota bacterium]